MDRELIILVVGAVLCLGVLYWMLSGNEAGQLRTQYFLSVRLPRDEAEKSLARHLAGLQQRHPGKSEARYLRQVLADLRRDRR
ncbi:hypothetical protein ACN28S_49355 [Cystobacter fuscus]